MSESKKFMAKVRRSIKNQPIPPHYNPDEWEGKEYNCYLYALRACFNYKFYESFLITPGFISQNGAYIRGIHSFKNKYTKKYIIQEFKKDIKSLGLRAYPTTINAKISSKEYKIAIYCKDYWDFHFARQDSDGLWSEKNGWKGKLQRIDAKDISKTIDGFKFIGVFRISKKS